MATKVKNIKEALEIIENVDPKMREEIRTNAWFYTDTQLILYAEAVVNNPALLAGSRWNPSLVQIGTTKNGDALWAPAD